MKKLIEFQEKIKEWSSEQILDEMMRAYYLGKGSNEHSKKEYESQIILMKMEIASRLKDEVN